MMICSSDGLGRVQIERRQEKVRPETEANSALVVLRKGVKLKSLTPHGQSLPNGLEHSYCRFEKQVPLLQGQPYEFSFHTPEPISRSGPSLDRNRKSRRRDADVSVR